VPITSSAKPTFSCTVLLGSSEVLEDDADLAAEARHLAAPQAGEIAAGHEHGAGRGQLVADEQLDERALARAGRADEEDEVALGHDEIDLDEGALPE
jgi:hypothetical protein